MKANSGTTKNSDMENTPGHPETKSLSIKDPGKMIREMAKENALQNQISLKETGWMTKPMDMESALTLKVCTMEMYMKDKSKWERDMEREHTYMKMEMSLLVIGKMI